MTRYVAPDALHAAFCFPALRTPWDARAIATTLAAAVAASDGRFAWPMSSHDDPRAADRFGGGDLGAARALAYFTLLAALPGVPFLYQGDELGLDNAVLDPAAFQDPASRGRPVVWSRDAVRTPMPWDTSEGRGFSTAAPWLPIPDNHGPARSAAAQIDDPRAVLHRYRALINGRDAWLPDTDHVGWLPDDDAVVGFRRGDVLVALNAGDDLADVDLEGDGDIRFASIDGVEIVGTHLVLPPDGAAVVALRR
jgi:alpha-glucosidase